MSSKEELLGGKVTGFEGPAPIAVEQISRFSLVRYLLGQKPDLNLNPEKTQYKEIFRELKGLPYRIQESLLVGFFTKEVKGFPNGESLGRKLTEINNISWFGFELKEEPDPTILNKHINDHLSRLGLDTLPLRIIDNWGPALDAAREATAECVALRTAWYVALRAAWDAADDAARVAARVVAWGAARVMVRDTTRLAAALGTALGTAWVAADDAAWVTVEDIMPNRGYKDNPFSPLTEIYKLGCWPIGVVPNKKGKQEFAIFIPHHIF